MNDYPPQNPYPDQAQPSNNSQLESRLISAYDSVLSFVSIVDQDLYNQYSTRPTDEQNCVGRMNELYLRLVEKLSEEKDDLDQLRTYHRDIRKKEKKREEVFLEEQDGLSSEIDVLKERACELKELISKRNPSSFPAEHESPKTFAQNLEDIGRDEIGIDLNQDSDILKEKDTLDD